MRGELVVHGRRTAHVILNSDPKPNLSHGDVVALLGQEFLGAREGEQQYYEKETKSGRGVEREPQPIPARTFSPLAGFRHASGGRGGRCCQGSEG